MVRITGVENRLAVVVADEHLTLGHTEKIAKLAGVTNIRYSLRSREERWALVRISVEGKIERYVAPPGGLSKLLGELMTKATRELIV